MEFYTSVARTDDAGDSWTARTSGTCAGSTAIRPGRARSHRPATAAGTTHPEETMRSKPVILAALVLGAFLVNLATTLVNVALPALVRGLHATTTQLQWVVDSCSLAFTALLLTFGSLSDRFGRKGMLLAGLAVVGGASRAGGFTAGPAQLIAAQPAHHNVLHDAATAQATAK